MSSSEPRAVFISYSSDDVEAAQRIANALREAGIEVWFDRSELRGGDAWDQNIRRQIKECALFLPIISQTTERRPEGYFRLEWRLADGRTHHMGRTKAFLIPVCIDPGINQGVADVPDSFLAVHWTLLPAGEPNQGFVDNVKTLLSGTISPDAGRTRPSFPFGSHPPTGAEPVTAPAAVGRPWFKRLVIGGVVATLLAGLGFVSFVRRKIEIAEDKIAVLPFEDLSDTPNAATGFADALQGDIIKKLDDLPEYTALPRPEVVRYRDNPKPIREVASDLTVMYIVTGTATRVGESIRMEVSLFSAWGNITILSRTYGPFPAGDRFAAQTAAANAITSDLKTALDQRAKTRQAEKQPPGAINAFTLYRDVTNAFGRDRITSAWLKKQEQLLQAAVDADENFAAGWALLGTIHSLFIAQGYDTSEDRYARAQNAIEAATSLDPESADTLRAEGIFLTEAMRDYPAAIAKFQAWQQKEPNAADPFGYLGAVYRHQAKWVEALASLREATTRDPGNLTHFRTLEQLAIEGRNYDQAGQTRTTILNLLTPGASARAGGLAGRGGRGGPPRFDPAADIPLLADLPEESYRLALIQLHGWGQTAPGDKLFASLTPEQAALPRFIALKTDWLRRTGRLDEAIKLDQQQPHFADDDDPAWRQAIDLAAAHAAKGDMAAARTRLNGVTGQLQSRLIGEPDNRRVNGWLGLAHALLGEKDAALRAGQEAVRLATSEGDAPAIATARLRFVLIQSWVGELDAAFAGLAPLLTQPGLETTIPAMKLDPWFAKLRADPRFATLTTDPLNNRVMLGDQGGRGGRGAPGDGGGQAFPQRGGQVQNPDPNGRLNRGGGGRGLPVNGGPALPATPVPGN